MRANPPKVSIMVKTKKTKPVKRNNAKSKKLSVKKAAMKSSKPVFKKSIPKKNLKNTKPAKSTIKNVKPQLKLPPTKLALAEAAAKLKDKEANKRKRTNVSIPQPEEAKRAIEQLLGNERAAEYLRKNVSKLAIDVVGMLNVPKTDEFLAEQLGMKINAIRRILNIMQGYGITNYYISKNTKGWLSFAWYINTSKLAPFLEYVDGMEKEKSIVSEKCNDYFMCESCYKTDKFLFTFDSAFESNFKCNSCGKNLERMDKTEVEVLINKPSPSLAVETKV